MYNKKILIIDDDLSLLRVIEHHLSEVGHTTTAISKPKEALKILDKKTFDIILCDMKMPDISGMDVLLYANKKNIDSLFIILTGFPTVDEAVKAMKLGAFDFIQKPVDKAHLLQAVEKASELITLRRENIRLKFLVKEQFEFDKIISRSGSMRKVCTQASQVARSSVPILITGGTGTGKELLAKAVHNNSKVKNGLFIAVNCGAIPENLIESELFGHKKGSFTGAISDRKGHFEMANDGSIFLDEIGDLPLDLQSKLLRVLQENTILPIGSSMQKKINVRVISATHRDLLKMISEGTFREDLYYRLNIVSLEIPPLKNRRDDIPMLFHHFMKEQLHIDGKKMPIIEKQVFKALDEYEWPGNVRELQNLARRLIVLNTGDQITVSDLPDNIHEQVSVSTFKSELPESGLDLEQWVDKIVVQALIKNEWNQSRTAKFLNVSRNTLIYRMEKRGLRKDIISKS